jgi:hypothetical protein
MRQLWPQQLKNDFPTLLARGNPPKVSVLEADFFQGWHDSIIFHEFVKQQSEQRGFSEILAFLPLKTQILHCCGAYRPQASTAR